MTMTMIEHLDAYLVLQWDHLTTNEMQHRIDWLRNNLVAGDDWGFCKERLTCVIKNEAASFMYKLRWFEPNNQTLSSSLNF